MHVRFVSAVLCGGVSSFPEGFEAAAEDAAAQGEDGIGAVDRPVHTGALEARPDGMFAASLDDAGGDAQAPGPERGIAHALTVADEIVDAFAGLVAGWGVVGESGDDGADAAGIEFVTSLFCPLRGEVGPGCVDGLGDVPEVAFGVEDVDDLDRIGETLVGEGPDPGCAVAEDDPAVGIGETAAFGFAAHALGEGGGFAVGIATGGRLDGGGVGD